MTSDTKSKNDAANQTLKYMSLVTLTGQNAMLGLSMRYARTRPGDMFISTTAVFMAELVKLITCLGLVWNDEDRSLSKWWACLDKTIIKQPMDKLVGFTAALSACCLSGFAGVYFEKILKGSDVSVWMRNVQLALLSVPMGLVTSYMKDGAKIEDGGFFHGYDNFVWFTVAQNALGGLLVAVVVKYADNILKGFACSLAIIITCVASIFIFDFTLSLQFSVGAACVIGSIFLYGYVPKPAGLPEKI